MFVPGSILYFTPFHFSNGNPPKNKYFVVLSSDASGRLLVVSLPTSKDHVPHTLPKEHGCINDVPARFNCYFFEAGRVVARDGDFSFPLDTYVYGEQVNTVEREYLEREYKPNIDYVKVAELTQVELESLKACLKSSANIKNKAKRYL